LCGVQKGAVRPERQWNSNWDSFPPPPPIAQQRTSHDGNPHPVFAVYSGCVLLIYGVAMMKSKPKFAAKSWWMSANTIKTDWQKSNWWALPCLFDVRFLAAVLNGDGYTVTVAINPGYQRGVYDVWIREGTPQL
jgi:hypothetical protein